MSTPRDAYVIQDTNGEWFYAVEDVDRVLAGDKHSPMRVSGPFSTEKEAADAMYSRVPNPGGHISTHVNQYGKNSRFAYLIADARRRYKTREGGLDDTMPRKSKQIDRGRRLGMKPADEIMHTTMTNTDPGPEMYRESGTDPNSFEQIASGLRDIKRARKSRKISRKARRGETYECGEQPLQGMALTGLLSLGTDGAISFSSPEQDPDDFVLDETWFEGAIQEFVDRTSTGENWATIVNDLARRFSEFFDGSFVAFDFASDAFNRRAWEMGLVETQIAMANFDLTEDFYGSDPKLPDGHRPQRVTGDEFDRVVKRRRLQKATGFGAEPFDWYVDEDGIAWAAASENSPDGTYFVWKREVGEAIHRGRRVVLEQPQAGSPRKLYVYSRDAGQRIRFGR